MQTPPDYLTDPLYIRDPKQFMQGYNAYGKGLPNPHPDDCEWSDSWYRGHWCAERYQEFLAVEALRERIERANVAEQRKHARTEKQKRNKENRRVRALAQSMAVRHKK